MRNLKIIFGQEFSWNGIIVLKVKNVKYLPCVIDVFTTYAAVKRLKDTVLNAFIEIVNESDRKPKNYRLIKEENFVINLGMNG